MCLPYKPGNLFCQNPPLKRWMQYCSSLIPTATLAKWEAESGELPCPEYAAAQQQKQEQPCLKMRWKVRTDSRKLSSCLWVEGWEGGWGRACYNIPVKVSGQPGGDSSVLPSCGSQESNSGSQSCWQAPLPGEPSH